MLEIACAISIIAGVLLSLICFMFVDIIAGDHPMATLILLRSPNKEPKYKIGQSVLTPIMPIPFISSKRK